MNRRQFIGGLIGGVAATAAVRTWPFRVFSFPREIALPNGISGVRFVRCYDPFENKFVSRFDILYGFGNSVPEKLRPEKAGILVTGLTEFDRTIQQGQRQELCEQAIDMYTCGYVKREDLIIRGSQWASGRWNTEMSRIA